MLCHQKTRFCESTKTNRCTPRCTYKSGSQMCDFLQNNFILDIRFVICLASLSTADLLQIFWNCFFYRYLKAVANSSLFLATLVSAWNTANQIITSFAFSSEPHLFVFLTSSVFLNLHKPSENKVHRDSKELEQREREISLT